MTQQLKHFINGLASEASEGGRVELVNPVTRDPLSLRGAFRLRSILNNDRRADLETFYS